MEKIASLTPQRALRAAALLYDLLPREMWEDQAKPSLARMETLSDRLQENAPAEITTFVDALRAEGNLESKGEFAKVLLQTFSEQETLRPYVEQAVSRSAEPQMAPVPLDIGTLLIMLGFLSSTVEIGFEQGKFNFKFKGNASELVRAFTGLVKALPSAVLERFK